ncbi:uncharacterized protein LOC130690267 [Daphnia carinata]|uniref:uncharacterized protein LOC130690267 n=1 Tax=Daphnia carinata TaxID=120202 RepID=UPI00257C9CA6|nr:uncharacterized protein LOC130690267 [Daphnia carinata]
MIIKSFFVFAVALVFFRTSECADEVSQFHTEALLYAPRLRFDSQSGDTLGQCLPGSAEDYFRLRQNGFTGRICNMDYISILDGRIPAYYEAAQCDSDLIISYWYFYGYKDDCPMLPGDPGDDVNWGRYVVKVLNGNQVDRVTFYQHEGWYTRHPGRYEVFESTHPVAYVGKLRQGTYHDDGGSGTCCYFEDYRNPGSPNKHMDSWSNLVWLRNNGSSTPEWMTNNDPYYWNGVSLPHLRGENLCDLRGCKGGNLQTCNTCGCHKSDVPDDQRP